MIRTTGVLFPILAGIYNESVSGFITCCLSLLLTVFLFHHVSIFFTTSNDQPRIIFSEKLRKLCTVVRLRCDPTVPFLPLPRSASKARYALIRVEGVGGIRKSGQSSWRHNVCTISDQLGPSLRHNITIQMTDANFLTRTSHHPGLNGDVICNK